MVGVRENIKVSSLPIMTLPKITTKQQSILILLYRFRFLNRIQIQTILKHKYHKRINDWLLDLTQKEYIGRIYSNKFGENTKPAIYHLNINGIKYLRTLGFPEEQLKRLHREVERSEGFVSKHLFIADICLNFQAKSTNEIKFAAQTKSDFTNPSSNYHFLTELGTDLAFAEIENGIRKYYLLEILEPTLPVYSFRKKIRNYIDFYFSNSWENNIGEDFPTIILVCETLPIMMSTRKVIKRILAENQDQKCLRLNVITAKEILGREL